MSAPEPEPCDVGGCTCSSYEELILGQDVCSCGHPVEQHDLLDADAPGCYAVGLPVVVDVTFGDPCKVTFEIDLSEAAEAVAEEMATRGYDDALIELTVKAVQDEVDAEYARRREAT